MDEKRFIRALWIAKACLVAILLYVGFQVATSRLQLGAVFDPLAASGRPEPADEPADLPEARPLSDYTAIVQKDLFTRGDKAKEARVNADNAPAIDTLASAEELGLRLIGAIAGGPTASRAIIQNTKTNASAPYKLGDTVASATVEAIQRDSVILRHKGQALVLRQRAGQAEDRGQKTEDREQTALAHPPSSVTSPVSSGSSRAGYMTDIVRQATIEPYVFFFQALGLRITGLDEIPMAAKLGLKNGDILQNVNGQQLTSKQKAFQVLMKARTQSRIDIQLLRDGKNKNLSFDL